MTRPPRLAQQWLTRRLSPDERDELLGDLEEQFHHCVQARGARAARRWYWRQAVALRWGFSVRRRDLISTAHERTRGRWAAETMRTDAKHAWRSLRHSPAFTGVALATITLAIGISTAMFSLVNGILLEPLPVPGADRLVRLGQSQPPKLAMFDGMINEGPSGGSRLADVSLGVWQARHETLAAIAPLSTNEVTLRGPLSPARVLAADVGPQFFDVFPITAIAGRVLGPADDDRAAPPVAVITERLWAERLGRRADVTDLTMTIEGAPVRIVGVVPATLDFLEPDIDVFEPLHFVAPDPARRRMFAMHLDVTARMAPGATLDRVAAEGQAVLASIAAAAEDTGGTPKIEVASLKDEVVRRVRPALTMLLVGIGCVLVAACVTLVSLLLSRNTARQTELAVRLALGASPWRIARPLLVEQMSLSAAGGALGALLAGWILRLLPAFAPADLPRLAEVRFDLRSLAFATGVAAVTAIATGLLPVWQLRRRNLRDVVSATHAAGIASGRSADAARSVLVVGQVTLATVLLVGAALVGHSLLALLRVDPGYRPEGVLTFQLAMDPEMWRQRGRQRQFFDDLEARLARNSAIVAAGHTTALPLHDGGSAGTYTIEGRTYADASRYPHAQSLAVTRGYLAAMGMRLIRGRLFTDADSPSSEPVAIVNDVFASRFLPGEDPVGLRVHTYAKVYARIVGVVAGARIGPMTADPPPAVIQYAPQMPDILGYGERGSGMAVRVTGDPRAVIPFIRDEVRALEPGWAIYDAVPLETQLHRTFAQPRFYTVVLGLFALLATSTAVLGLYGVLAYAVERRRHEVGIRRALGAEAQHIVALVTRRAAMLASAGLVTGIGAMALAARAMRAWLFGVAPLDILSFGAGVLTILAVVVVASWVPVRRALTIDPAHVLRVE